jgi:hypothetical protein
VATVIPLTQYLRPNGRKTPVSINRTVVSTECLGPPDDDGEPRCLAIEVVPNGPEVPEAVDRLVRSALDAITRIP